MDQFSKHEVVDRVHIMDEMWERFIMRHPVVNDSESEVWALANSISGDIAKLYQLVGSKYL